MITEEEINKLAKALHDAQIAADAIKDVDDSGSCNMDQVTIVLEKWRASDVSKVCAITGISIGDKIGSSMWRMDRFINFRTHGQASRNYTQVQAAYKVLLDAGFNVNVFYRLD